MRAPNPTPALSFPFSAFHLTHVTPLLLLLPVYPPATLPSSYQRRPGANSRGRQRWQAWQSASTPSRILGIIYCVNAIDSTQSLSR